MLLLLAGAYSLLIILMYRMTRKEMNFTRFSAIIICLISPVLVIAVLFLKGKTLVKFTYFMDKWVPMYVKKKKDDNNFGR